MATESTILKTHITGQINGSAFECTGEGEWTNGQSSSQLKFTRPLEGFTPLACASWKCKGHVVKALVDPQNPLDEYVLGGGNILDRTIIHYPFQNSTILMTSITEQHSHNELHVYQTRVGIYTGPTDIVDTPQFTIRYVPTGPGRALAHSVRSVVFSDHRTEEFIYRDELFFTDGFELPYAFEVDIDAKGEYDTNEHILALNVNALGRRPTD